MELLQFRKRSKAPTREELLDYALEATRREPKVRYWQLLQLALNVDEVPVAAQWEMNISHCRISHSKSAHLYRF